MTTIFIATKFSVTVCSILASNHVNEMPSMFTEHSSLSFERQVTLYMVFSGVRLLSVDNRPCNAPYL